MSCRPRCLLVVLLSAASVFSATKLLAQQATKPVPQSEPADRTVVLDTAGFWRMHYTFKLPMLLREGKAVPLAEVATEGFLKQPPWLKQETALPPDGWFRPDFDDSSWERICGRLVTTMNSWGEETDSQSPYSSLICARGKFAVSDPERAGELSLAVEYRGGVVVWLNGERVAQAHMRQEGGGPQTRNTALGDPSGGADELAQPAGAAEKLPRRLDCRVPPKALRKGVNVLCVAVHRAPLREDEVILNGTKWPQGVVIPHSPCALENIRLSAPAAPPGTIQANVTRPRGFQVWNSNTLATDFDMDFGDPNETLKPIHIVGTRGGAFSGKVVVGSDAEIKGLRAAVGPLAQAGGTGRIPVSEIEIRYGRPHGSDFAANFRYMAEAQRLDALDDVAPETVDVRITQPVSALQWVGEGKNKHRETRSISLVSAGVKPVFGATCSIWVTVHVPADAAPGRYTGTLTVSAADAKAVEVPVNIDVSGWRVPEPKDWQVFTDIIQSPETLAIAYNAPMWSDQHFALIEQSLKMLGRVGTKTVYLSMICETNLGNAETIVRWVPGADGTYDIDFAAFDRYMDLVRKHLGAPPAVILYVWDKFLERDASRGQWEGDDQKTAIDAAKGKGPEVTQLDPATGKTSRLQLPLYSDPKAVAMWKPVSEGIRQRMEKWGMSRSLMLGIMCDYMPSQESLRSLGKIFPDVKWVSQAHPLPHKSVAAQVGYASHVFGDEGYRDPAEKRLYGWKRPELLTNYWRYARNNWPITSFRYMAEFTLMRGERGFARMGGDFFPVLKDRRGRVTSSIAARYVKSYWNNLNIEINLLAMGARGPVATARLDSMREGLEHCEARIFIERALTDPSLRARLGDDLAVGCQEVLDERARFIRRGLCTYVASGHYEDWAIGNGWIAPPIFGSHWYISSGWEERSRKLFDAAEEVARKLDASPARAAADIKE
ncbi:MAG: glycoside hydrolase domain-containing protein [Phycisphaerae bacterium]